MAKHFQDLTGEQLVDCNEQQILGTITHQYQEGGRLIAVINGDYEIYLDGCSFILDVFGVARERNPALKASYVRLARS